LSLRSLLAGELSPHLGMVEAGFRKRIVRRKLTAFDQMKLSPKLSAIESNATTVGPGRAFGRPA
jgi:hypothetical protein